MRIDIWHTKIPSAYENIEVLKKVIGYSEVTAFSIDENNLIVEGVGCIKSNDSYNYHNNYDDSEDCMYFDNKQQWFTLNYDRILEVQKENNNIILNVLEPIINKVRENV